MAVDLKRLLRQAKQDDLIITPRYNHFLLSGGFDQPLRPEVAKIIHDLLVKPPRVRKGTFSSSSAGRCLRRQEFEYMGIDPGGAIDPRLANIFDDGRWRHLRWQARLLQANIIDAVEVAIPVKSLRSWSTLDGEGVVPANHPRIRWRNQRFGFELKGINSWGFDIAKMDERIKEEHLDQVHRYFLASGHRLFVILYESKNSQEWYEWAIEADPQRLLRQKRELLVLNNDRRDKELQPRLAECQKRTGKVFHECPFGGVRGVCLTAPGRRWPSKKEIAKLSAS
jgi:hypothetical protein